MRKKSVLITGSSKGLGKDLALVFAEKNYGVILHGRDKKGLEIVAEQISKKTSSHIIIGNLRTEKTIQDLYNIAKQKNISTLINNAGVPCPGLPFKKLTEEKIMELLEVNLLAPIRLTKKIYPLFLEKNYGTIININSIIGLEEKKFRSIACAFKWGLRGFSKSLRLEAEEKNIRVANVYISRTKTKPEYDYGMDSIKVAFEIYNNCEKGNVDELIIDGRPEEFKEKKNLNKLIIDGKKYEI